MEEPLILPKVFQLPGNNVREISENFLNEMIKISESQNFHYADQCILKILEYLDTLASAESDKSFLVKLKEQWSKTLMKLLLQSDIQFELNFRIKSLSSLFSKINRVMIAGKSLETIHDIIGIEIIVYSTGQYDSKKSIMDCYKAANIALDFFTTSPYHRGDYFSLYPCKGKMQANTSNVEDLITLKTLNPHIILPNFPLIEDCYTDVVRDYVANPKITTGYQGIQFAVAGKQGVNLEVQIKTQAMRDYLDKPESPGAHALYKESFEIPADVTIPLFDLSYDENDLLNRIPGFRSKGSDRSGIIDPIKWNLRKHPF